MEKAKPEPSSRVVQPRFQPLCRDLFEGTATRVKKAATRSGVNSRPSLPARFHTFLSFRERTLGDGLAPDREMVSHYMFSLVRRV